MRESNLRRFVALAMSALFTITLGVGAAGAAPVDTKQAEAARLARQLDAEGQRVAVLAEQYNRARLSVEQARADSAQVNGKLTRAEQQFAQVRDRMARVAIESYIHGGNSSTLEHMLQATGEDVIARRQYLDVAAAGGKRTLDNLKAAREDLQALRAQNRTAQQQAEAAAQALAGKKAAADHAVAANQATLRRVKGELGELVRAEEARRSAAQTARVKPPPGLLPGGRSFPNVPVGHGAASAVAEAQRQVGKPYVYGGSGPDSFDCSGLTAWAWRAGGVSLPHSATAQYNAIPHVAFSDLQPGDLLFFYSDIHHVAIYVGGGQIVEASQTGTPVKYSSASRPPFYGAGRPG
jgi:cell wall-associated NlpC family hydrolase